MTRLTVLIKRKKDLEEELGRIVNLIVKLYHPEKIILFGSLKNGDIRETSDIDLLVIKNTDKSYLQRIDEIVNKIHPQLALDIFVLTPQEVEKEIEEGNPYIKEIIDEGAIIYERKS